MSSRVGEHQPSVEINSTAPQLGDQFRRSLEPRTTARTKGSNYSEVEDEGNIEYTGSDIGASASKYKQKSGFRSSDFHLDEKLDSLAKMNELLLESGNVHSASLQSLSQVSNEQLEYLGFIKEQTSKYDQLLMIQNSKLEKLNKFLREFSSFKHKSENIHLPIIPEESTGENNDQEIIGRRRKDQITGQVSPSSGYESTLQYKLDENLRRDVKLILNKLNQIQSSHSQPNILTQINHDQEELQPTQLSIPDIHKQALQQLNNLSKSMDSSYSGSALNHSVLLSSFVSEITNNKFFNLTHMIFRISSLMVNCIADLIKDNPNYRALRKELIK